MSYSSEVLADSPGGYWRMEESSGYPQDSSGNGNHFTTGPFGGGTLSYSQTGALASDPTSKSIRWNAIADIRTPDHATLDLGDVFTMEMWVKRATDGDQQDIMGKGAGAYFWRFLPTTNQLQLGRFGVADIVESTVAITADGEFHHVVATKNGATVKLYVDTADVTGTVTNSTAVNTTVGFNIGSQGADGPNDVGVDGWLDEVAVYPTALSLARVQAHYDAALAETVFGYQRLYGPAQLGTTAATLYTAPDDSIVEIRHIWINNPSGGTVKPTLSIGADAASTRYLELEDIVAGGSYDGRRRTNHTLVAGEVLQGKCDTAATAVITIDGFVEQV